MVAGTSGLLHPSDSTGGAALHSRTIRPTEIHKSRPENVWVHQPVEESPYSLATSFSVPVTGRALRFVDLVEVQRQVGILQAHRQLGVPDGEVFTLDRISLKLVTRASESEVPRDRGSIRSQIVATATRGRARSLMQHFTMEGPVGLVAVGSARASLIPRGVYDRVRERARRSSPLSALSLRPDFSYQRPLRIDPTDPLLSDHPSDHVTAIQTIADVERVALDGRPHAGIRSLRLTFQRYADAMPSPVLQLEVLATGRLVAEVLQLGVCRARVTGTLTSMEGH